MSTIEYRGFMYNTKPDSQEYHKLLKARKLLSIQRPYVNMVLLSLFPIETDAGPTVAVDKHHRLYYNPEFVRQVPVEELAGVLYHECWHILLMHHSRPRAGNIAKDLEINDDILRENMPIVKEVVTPDKFGFPDNLTAEEYQELLDKLYKKSFEGGVCSGNCGSVADGKDHPYDLPEDKAPGVDPGESKQIAAATAEAAKSIGNVPEWVKRWANNLFEPKLPWRQVLRSAISRSVNIVSGAQNHTYAKPPRKVISGVIYPRYIANIPDIAVVVDTSGSVNETDLNKSVSEIAGVLSVYPSSSIKVIPCSTVAGKVQRVISKSQLRNMEFDVSGGTDMGEGLKKAEELNVDVCIVLTDGHTPWPLTRPRISEIVIVFIGKGSSDIRPPWRCTFLKRE